MSTATKKIDSEKLTVAAEVLRAIAHPLRMKLLGFIDKHGRINVNKIYGTLKLEQSITSQHLRILRQAGLVNTEREGKFIFYTINYDKVKKVVDDVNDYFSKK